MRRALRISGVSVQEMADYLGVSRNTVGTWINGRIEPRVQSLRLWALKTGVPFEWLQDGRMPAAPDPDGTELRAIGDSNPAPADSEVHRTVSDQNNPRPTAW